MRASPLGEFTRHQPAPLPPRAITRRRASRTPLSPLQTANLSSPLSVQGCLAKFHCRTATAAARSSRPAFFATGQSTALRGAPTKRGLLGAAALPAVVPQPRKAGIQTPAGFWSFRAFPFFPSNLFVRRTRSCLPNKKMQDGWRQKLALAAKAGDAGAPCCFGYAYSYTPHARVRHPPSSCEVTDFAFSMLHSAGGACASSRGSAGARGAARRVRRQRKHCVR